MSGRRPLIGVCSALERAHWAMWDLPADILPRMYVDAVQRAGGAAVLLPVDAGWIERPAEALDVIDGLVLAGGSDIDPATYGADRHPQTGESLAARDDCEIALLRAALDRDMPVLGICRGMQLINVAAGGTLDQHLFDDQRAERHLRTLGEFRDADHSVLLEADTLAARAVGATRVFVKSHHHQGVARLGECLRVSGVAELDRLPEAIELPDRRFALGVQWHPEAGDDDQLMRSFVAAAAG